MIIVSKTQHKYTFIIRNFIKKVELQLIESWFRNQMLDCVTEDVERKAWRIIVNDIFEVLTAMKILPSWCGLLHTSSGKKIHKPKISRANFSGKANLHYVCRFKTLQIKEVTLQHRRSRQYVPSLSSHWVYLFWFQWFTDLVMTIFSQSVGTSALYYSFGLWFDSFIFSFPEPSYNWKYGSLFTGFSASGPLSNRLCGITSNKTNNIHGSMTDCGKVDYEKPTPALLCSLQIPQWLFWLWTLLSWKLRMWLPDWYQIRGDNM